MSVMPVVLAGGLASVSSAGLAGWLELALDRAPGLSAREAEVEAARRQARLAGAPPPVKLNYVYAPRPLETRLGPQRHRVALSQAVPWPGRLAGRKRQADASSARAAHAKKALARVLVQRIGRAYAALWSAETRLELAQDLRKLRYRGLEALRAEAELSTVRPKAVAEGELFALRTDLLIVRLEGERRRAAARLRGAAGLLPDGPASASGLPDLERSDGPARSDAPSEPASRERERPLHRSARESHPALLSAEASIEAARGGVAAAEALLRPDVSFGVAWLEVGGLDGGSPKAGQDAVLLEVGLALPVWLGARSDRVDAAKARMRAEAHRREVVALELDTRKAEARAAEEEAKAERAILEERSIPAAARLVAMLRSDLALGVASYGEVVAAENTLLEAQSRVVEVMARQFSAELEGLVLTRSPAAVVALLKAGGRGR